MPHLHSHHWSKYHCYHHPRAKLEVENTIVMLQFCGIVAISHEMDRSDQRQERVEKGEVHLMW